MRKSGLIVLTALLGVSFISNAQKINPITQAVLQGYEETLKENPKDYFTLYQRAVQYYNLSMYDRAILDLEDAIKYTPEKEKDLKINEFTLLSDAYIEKGEYEKALSSIRNALTLNPQSYPNTYKLGNICLYLNRPEEAYNAFKSMQRMQSRSQEAFFGMAKADIMMGNRSEAEQFMKEAEKVDPTNYITFCRLGDLYQDLGQNEKAATNYLVAYSMADNSMRPIESLVLLSRKDMKAVLNALDYTISQAPDNLMLQFMKANLLYDNGNFKQAETALHELLKLPEAQDPSVYRMLALTQKALNKQADAIANIDKAVNLNRDKANLLAKAEILLASNPEESVRIANEVLGNADSDKEALLIAAKGSIMSNQNEQALKQLNTLSILDPSNIEALTLRGWLNENRMKDEKLASLDFSRASNGIASQFPGLLYLAYAKSKAGKQMDAESIIAEELKENPDNKDILFYAGNYYALTGNIDKAVENIKKAIQAGYDNEYMLYKSTEPLGLTEQVRKKL